MSDNPFSEPEDNERTVLRLPKGRTPAGGPGPAAAPGAAGLPGGAAGGAPAAPLPGAAAAPPPPPFGAPAAVPPGAPAAPFGEATVMRGAAGAGPAAMPKLGRSPMTAAAAPLLDLLARIGARASPVSNAEDLRNRAMQALHAFEAECRAAQVSDEQLRAAHYALCAALDDTALATPWGQASGWASRSLSATFHQDVRSGERFFDMLAGMQKEPGRYLPALEICYLCLSLGMRGRYRLDPRGSAEVERIREGLYQIVARGNGPWERELSPHWRGVDAPHRGPGRRVPAWVIAAVALSVLALGYLLAWRHVDSNSDALQERLAQLPPVAPPTLVRAAAPVAPAAAPGAGPSLEARFRTFLAPEIERKLVSVTGDAQGVMIRIQAGGMFGSGSADIEPGFVELLKRIGEALRAERGDVLVIGHSDNQPIRRGFASNFELSKARAESARKVVAGAAGQEGRFSAVGRGANEPLASNATAAGRETNRRIEIVLARREG